MDPCTLDQESGVGSVQLTRFYFNKQNKLCEEFVYFGAGGNRNNFLTVEECQAQCPGAGDACVLKGILDGGAFSLSAGGTTVFAGSAVVLLC